MEEFVTALNRLSEETKELKALLQTLLKLSRIRLLKEEWVDGQDLSSALHISQRTLQNLRESGKLPYSKFNDRKYFYRYSDIRALLKSSYFKNHPNKKTT
jgi:hypothetical protein